MKYVWNILFLAVKQLHAPNFEPVRSTGKVLRQIALKTAENNLTVS